MSENLTVKHTNSLTLKKNKLLQKANKSKICCLCSRPYKLVVFCVMACCIFLIYWIILSPLLISVFYSHNAHKTDKTSVAWLALYWFIAFLIWLLIMVCLILIWKCFDFEQTDHIKIQSHGTSNSVTLPSMVSVKYSRPRTLKLAHIKEDKPLNDLVSDKNDVIAIREKNGPDISDKFQRNRIKKHPDLPPLVIHRHNSGNDIERTGTINFDEDADKNNEDEGVLRSGNDIYKSHGEFRKDYFTLVTVTPEDEIGVKSPKGQLSPRELFFIDLIREAEKAEGDKVNNDSETTEGKHVVPRDIALAEKQITKGIEDEKNITKDVENEKKKSLENPTNITPEFTYFIASIERLKNEKSEIYLEIDTNSEPVQQWSINLDNKKPVLMLQENSERTKNERNDEKLYY